MRSSFKPAMALAFAAMFGFPGANNAYSQTQHAICHNYLVKGKMASAAKQSKAKERARDKWFEKVVSIKGGRWGNWRIAKQKEYLCGYAGRWYCNARAQPCLKAASTHGLDTKPANPGSTTRKPIK